MSVRPRIAVLVFPGSNDDRDAAWALGALGADPMLVWHAEQELPRGTEAVVLPGGFSYGDYLRCGAIARFAPVLDAVRDFVAAGGPVLGICNGFQILCEAGLLPGALVRNAGLHFVCRDQRLAVEAETAWTADLKGREIVVPVKNAEGRYVADAATLAELEDAGRIVFRYKGGNPNGSLNDIAGVASADGRVVGLMPHPEHAIDRLTGPSTDGLALFTSVLRAAART
jgi:phosphoribosylformylglycinamidine synthase subunit PurQ / glutaminase